MFMGCSFAHPHPDNVAEDRSMAWQRMAYISDTFCVCANINMLIATAAKKENP